MKKMRKSIFSYILTIVMILSASLVPIEIYAEEGAEQSDKKVKVEADVAYPEAPEISAKAGILMDIDTGAIIYEKNVHEKLYPASITKIMTGLLAVENTALDSTFTFTSDIINQLPWDAAKYGYVAGEEVNIRDLLYVLMLRSANEVAIGLGINISGSEAEFGKLMTERAKEAGALNTNFTNASGLHDDNHYTTAYDMAMIAKAAIGNPTFAQVWGEASYIVQPTSVEPDVVRIWNRHEMLVNTKASYYQYAKGGKTGYTDEAGRTLVTYASKDGMNLVCVVMKTDTGGVYKDTRALFEYGFNNFKKINVNGNESRFGQSVDGYFVSHDNMFDQSTKLMTLTDDYVTIPKDAKLSQIGYELEYCDITEDNVIANISYTVGSHYLGQTELILNIDENSSQEVSPYKQEPTRQEEEKEELPINIWLVAGIIVAIIIVIFVIYILKKTKRKRKARRDRKKLFKGNKLH